MALNKIYWEYSSAHSEDWINYGIRYADKQIYANPNFSWGALDYSFPTSFRSGQKVTILHCGNDSRQQSAETLSDVIIYNAMINAPGSGSRNSFYNDTYYSSYNSGDEGYFPVIDIDTHDFAYKMTVSLFTSGNWVTVNAVDFVNNYDNYAAGVYGYIDNRMHTGGNDYAFCNFYNAGDEQFTVKANYDGYRTSGYGNTHKGGHACSGQTAWSNRGIWQLASGTAAIYSNPSTPYNMCFPFEIPEINGQSWNCGNESAPAALMTGGVYTNHAVLSYSDQRVYVPLKHILRDIIVNCGLVLLDSNDDKWISMVDENGLCQNKLVLMSSDEAKESSIYNTRTSDNNLNPSPAPPGPSGSDEDNNDPISTANAPYGTGIAHYYAMTAGSVLLEHVSEALGTWDIDSSKKDLYRNLISCKLIKPPAAIPTSGSENFTIYGVEPQYQGNPILLPVVSGNPSATFGPYSISRKFGDFRDFAPYSKAEIFLPYCGWTALPSHVIGRSVTVKYFTDIIAATCKAVVFCGNNVVAEAAGVIGLDIPFASENVGAKMEAANMGLLASTLGAVQTAVGVGTMVSTKSGSGLKNVTSGLSQVISGCTQISMAGNENWTEINGKAGDGCSLAGIDTIIIKITRPKYGANSTPPYVPSGYAHNIGYVAMKQTKPGSVTGLIVCDNVDTSGISGATQRERELIKSYLESGIIVNAVSP